MLKIYPNWESIEKIGKKLKINIEVAQFLYSCGLLMVREAPPEQETSPKKRAANLPVKQTPKKNGPVEMEVSEKNISKKKKKRRNRKQ